jgi:hypothetical protein
LSVRAVVVAIGLMGGCCDAIVTSESVDPPPGAAEAQDVAEAMLGAELGEREAFVTWVTRISYDGEMVGGAAISCEDIFVVVRGEAPSDTTLAHELAHCYVGDVPASGCSFTASTHAGPVWEAGGLVDQVNDELASLGL